MAIQTWRMSIFISLSDSELFKDKPNFYWSQPFKIFCDFSQNVMDENVQNFVETLRHKIESEGQTTMRRDKYFNPFREV